jgi:hypothetical protein
MAGFVIPSHPVVHMHPPLDSVAPSSVLSRRATVALMFAMVLAGAAGLVAWGPVGLVPHMHHFADTRMVWGTPNGGLVWSHLPLLPIGAWGLWRVSRLPSDEPLRGVWATFFCCQMMATVGGMVYHWQPNDLTFVGDQLPRSAACSLFAAAFLAERIDRRFGGQMAISVALLATCMGGLWWLGTLNAWGVGDLRPLLLLELSPIAMVATGAWTLRGHLLTRQDWMRSQLSFVVAQTIDWADAPIFEWTGHVVSGHALRHVALATCVGWVAYRLGYQSKKARQLDAERALQRGTQPVMALRDPAGLADQANVTSFPDNRLAS